MDEVWSDGLEIDKHIVELFQNKETTGHALATWDSVALGWRCADHLEEVLSDTHMIFLITLLTNDGVDNCFEDVLLGENTFHILDQSVSFVDIIVL